MNWSEPRQEAFRRYWAEGLTNTQIAELMPCSRDYVALQARRMGLPGRNVRSDNAGWTPQRIGELTKLWADGLSARQIADRLETTRNAVIGKVQRLGLAERRPNGNRVPSAWTPEKIKILTSMWANNEGADEIANRLGVPRRSITDKIRRLDRPERKMASPPSRILASISGPPLSPIPKVEAPPLAPVDNGQIGVLLLDLDPGRCKWPIAYCDEGHVFCGRKTPDGQPYCRAHARMAYAPQRARAA